MEICLRTVRVCVSCSNARIFSNIPVEETILSNPKPYELCLLLYPIMMAMFEVSSVSSIKTELPLESH